MVMRRALRARGDRGAIAVVTVLLSVILLVFTALAIDLGRWFVEGQRLQRTVDAAALAGAPYLPGDLARARTEARKLIASNGFDSSVAAVPDTAIAQDGVRPSRLTVTMSTDVPNAFATVIGSTFKTVTRSATADFAAAATMGSPCNVMGNEPPAGGAPTTVGSAACPPAPNFWQNIAGPEAPKRNGDRYTTRSCSSPDSNCVGGRNLDYSGGPGIIGSGYYVYKITPRAPMTSFTVQLYDPMFVEVGDFCETNLTRTTNGLWTSPGNANQPNPFVTDATTRYSWGIAQGSDAGRGQVATPATTPATATWLGRYCTGDVRFGGNAADLNTSFLVLNPTDTLNPLQATQACTPRTYGGFSGNLQDALRQGSGSYNATVAQHFRQWVTLCTVTVPTTSVGRDFYVMVRTNVPANPTTARMQNPAEDSSTRGNGHNRYGIRVLANGGSNSDVAISALERLPIYANLRGGTTDFYLARVASANAGAQLNVTFFDTGDASDVASIRIEDPSGGAPSGCRATGEVVPGVRPASEFNTATCTLTNVFTSNGYNGRIQRIEIPVPSTYTCNDADPTACWYRLKFTYPPGVTANDTTTWSASLDGDPVRLVR
jgi:Flp pilus assembly protein TadG